MARAGAPPWPTAVPPVGADRRSEASPSPGQLKFENYKKNRGKHDTKTIEKRTNKNKIREKYLGRKVFGRAVMFGYLIIKGVPRILQS